MRKFTAAGAAALLVLASQNLHAAPADELRALISQGKAAQAYILGKQYPQELGKPEFDFYFGVAAVDSGHAGEGVLALERYVVQFPANVEARLELGRAYFVLGELVRAREEFDTVQRLKPPSEVQGNIDRYLDAIKAQETRYKASANAYFEVGGGYDTNINSGVDNQNVNLPTGAITVVPAGVKQKAWFGTLATGAQGSLPVAAGVSIVGGFNADGKWHEGSELKNQFDQNTVNVFGGARVVSEKDVYNLQAAFNQFQLDHTRFRQFTMLSGDWLRQVNETNQGGLQLAYAKFDYPTQQMRNSDLYAIGGVWRHAMLNPLRPVLTGNVMFARENNDGTPVREDLTRNLFTLRGGLAVTPAPQWSLSSALTYTWSGYKEADPLVGDTRRKDNFIAVELGAAYRITKPLSLRLDYTYYNNRSNIDLYEYSRHIIALKARLEI